MVAIVPLGLTRYNTDPRLTAVTPDFCRQIIAEVSAIQADLRERLRNNLRFWATKFICAPDGRCPARSHYGDYPQIEDGIGMVRSFRNEFAALLKTDRASIIGPGGDAARHSRHRYSFRSGTRAVD